MRIELRQIVISTGSSFCWLGVLFLSCSWLPFGNSLAVGSPQLFTPRIDAVPAGQLPLSYSQSVETQAVDVSKFRIPRPSVYTLDKGDVLGVFVEGVLGEMGASPPVHYPDARNDLPPSMGFPIPVREDGTISIPLLDPVVVRGLSIRQVEELLKQKFRDPENPIISERSRVLVSHMRKRTVGVFVMRGDNSRSSQPLGFARSSASAVSDRSDRSGRLSKIQLPVGDNDLLTAMSLTGGLPGLNAKSEVKIYRSNSSQSSRSRYGRSSGMTANGGSGGSPFPRTSAGGARLGGYDAYGNYQGSRVTSVPTRTTARYQPHIDPTDARLNNGDVVVIEPRNTEFYYTGGLLGGGQFLLPRDHGLDVLEAVSLAGGTLGSRGQSFGAVPSVTATELIVLRKGPNGSQMPIRVDLNAALVDRRQRVQVQPGDVLILRHSRGEQWQNLGIGVFNTYGTRSLLGR